MHPIIMTLFQSKPIYVYILCFKHQNAHWLKNTALTDLCDIWNTCPSRHVLVGPYFLTSENMVLTSSHNTAHI